MKIHMFLGYDNLSYTVQALSKLDALIQLDLAGVKIKCYLGAQ
jgi:hypothetical protein